MRVMRVGGHLEVSDAQLVTEDVRTLEEDLTPLVESGHVRRGRGGL
jgi:hypothetical protein